MASLAHSAAGVVLFFCPDFAARFGLHEAIIAYWMMAVSRQPGDEIEFDPWPDSLRCIPDVARDAALLSLQSNGIVASSDTAFCYSLTNCPKRVRPDHIWDKSGGRCWYCGAQQVRGGFHRDHVIPSSRGGSGRRDNLVVSCRECNSRKGALSIDEFRAKLSNNTKELVLFAFEIEGWRNNG